MKKLLSLIISLMLVFSLVGCESSNSNPNSKVDNEQSIDENKENSDNQSDEVTDTEEELEKLYPSTEYEGTDTCPECGKDIGLKEDGTTYCKYCNYKGKYEPQEDNENDNNSATTLNCPNCGRKINVYSNTETNCPYCSYYNNENTGETGIYDDNYNNDNSNNDNSDNKEDCNNYYQSDQDYEKDVEYYEDGGVKDGTALGEHPWNQDDYNEEDDD